jgi:hypothetical protein
VTDRFVVLGVAAARSPWFAEVAQWAHAGSIPVEFVKCVSAEQARTRLASGRAHSAALFDGALPTVDRDLLEAAHDAGAAALVIDAGERHAHWRGLGADAVLPATFGPADLTEALWAHAAMVPTAEWAGPVIAPEREAASPGPLVVLCGPGGTGVSTLAMAFAQQWASDRSRPLGEVVLADLRRHAELGVLHDAGDVGPGVQELVDLCRTATPDVDQVRRHTYAVDERGYALLLGLRRPTAWATLRPRSVSVALDRLRRAFGGVVCDCDADFEGQAEGGSLDVEERNALARVATTSASAVFAVGLPGLKGVYSLARLVGELADVGVEPGRIVPVFNRVGRGPRFRARSAAAFAALLEPWVRTDMASPVFVPDRAVDDALHDRSRLPAALASPLLGAFHAVHGREPTTEIAVPAEARRIQPGEVGAWAEEIGAS